MRVGYDADPMSSVKITLEDPPRALQDGLDLVLDSTEWGVVRDRRVGGNADGELVAVWNRSVTRRASFSQGERQAYVVRPLSR